VTARHTLGGLLVDPVDGARPGILTLNGDRIEAVDFETGAPEEPFVLPGLLDLQVYDAAGLVETGVTGYLLTVRAPLMPDDPLCLGLHLEGPFLNPEAAGAIPVEEIRPVDLTLLDEWLESGPVRLVTIAPEIPGGIDAIALVARSAVAGIGHTRANAATTRAAIEAGGRFATHTWNAMAPLRARATGPLAELLLDPRVTLGLVADGRHVHPRVEELTVRVAGPERIALTSDRVALPAQRSDGTLLGGDRSGAALVARMARFGLAEAAGMASLVPARVLGLPDRGRLLPGHRADLTLLSRDFAPLETIVAGETAWSVRYPERQDLDELPPSTNAPGAGA
jgi:N-acetylglucosamine-6-phosphate deacetylase